MQSHTSVRSLLRFKPRLHGHQAALPNVGHVPPLPCAARAFPDRRSCGPQHRMLPASSEAALRTAASLILRARTCRAGPQGCRAPTRPPRASRRPPAAARAGTPARRPRRRHAAAPPRRLRRPRPPGAPQRAALAARSAPPRAGRSAHGPGRPLLLFAVYGQCFVQDIVCRNSPVSAYVATHNKSAGLFVSKWHAEQAAGCLPLHRGAPGGQGEHAVRFAHKVKAPAYGLHCKKVVCMAFQESAPRAHVDAHQPGSLRGPAPTAQRRQGCEGAPARGRP